MSAPHQAWARSFRASVAARRADSTQPHYLGWKLTLGISRLGTSFSTCRG